MGDHADRARSAPASVSVCARASASGCAGHTNSTAEGPALMEEGRGRGCSGDMRSGRASHRIPGFRTIPTGTGSCSRTPVPHCAQGPHSHAGRHAYFSRLCTFVPEAPSHGCPLLPAACELSTPHCTPGRLPISAGQERPRPAHGVQDSSRLVE